MKLFKLLTCVLACLGTSGMSYAQSPSLVSWYKVYNDSLQGVNVSEAVQFLESQNLRVKKPVIVGIIDSGIDTTSIDLKPALWINAKEKLNGKDSDKNGYIDDIHGWNFLGTADGSFNMTSAGTQEFREFKRLFPKYKNIDSTQVDNQEEYAYYEAMKRKAGIANYIKFAQYMDIKDASYKYMDAVMQDHPGLNKDTLTVAGLLYLPIATDKWNEACQVIFADIYKAKKTDLWNDVLAKHVAYLELVEQRIASIEKDEDKRLLMGDDMNNPKDRFYGNAILQAEGSEHGTAVAGLIAGQGLVEEEVSGVFPQARLMILRAAPDGDEYDKDIASAIRYAVDNGAKVINMSLGKFTSPRPDMVNDAIAYAAKKDVLIIQAAGNNGKNIDEESYFPSAISKKGERFANYMRVGSSDMVGARSKFSNYGAEQVDVFAPGEKIVCITLNNDFMISQGSSLSAPIVSGVASLIRAYFPKLKAHQVKDILMKSVRPMDEAGLSVSGGVVDALKAVQLARSYKR